MVAILAAYALNVFGRIDSTGQAFLWLNITGSAGIVAVSWRKRTYQPMILNIAWLLIAALGLFQLLT